MSFGHQTFWNGVKIWPFYFADPTLGPGDPVRYQGASRGALEYEIILIPAKSNVVDIVTDSTDARQHRNSLFVLSQSDRLAGERPKLIDFLKVFFY